MTPDASETKARTLDGRQAQRAGCPPVALGSTARDGTDPEAVRRALQAFLDHRCRSNDGARAATARIARAAAEAGARLASRASGVG